jgi:hypothetical protein
VPHLQEVVSDEQAQLSMKGHRGFHVGEEGSSLRHMVLLLLEMIAARGEP